jgi:DNA-binding XRE family transcriptional regulator
MGIMSRARTPSNPWPAKLLKLRERWDATQTEAAAKIGVTLRSWASWERGERVPLKPMQLLIDCLLKSK